jgi:hypothetical protein
MRIKNEKLALPMFVQSDNKISNLHVIGKEIKYC